MRLLAAILLILLPGAANAGSVLYYQMASAVNMGLFTVTAGVDTKLLTNSAIQAIYNGTPSGTMLLQVSNDNVPYGITSPSQYVVNWADLPNSPTSPSISGSTSGSTIFTLANMGFRWVRLKYTPSGSLPQSCGGCFLTVNFFGKGD